MPTGPADAHRRQLEDEPGDRRRGARALADGRCARRSGASSASTIVVCPPTIWLGDLRRDALRGLGDRRRSADDALRAERGAFTGETSPLMLARASSPHTSSSATPSAGSTTARPMRRSGARSPARWPTGCVPIAAVGERRRSDGPARRRAVIERQLAGGRGRARGPGRHRARDRLRAGLGHRHRRCGIGERMPRPSRAPIRAAPARADAGRRRRGAHPVRRQRDGRQRRRVLRPARHRRRAGRRRVARAASSSPPSCARRGRIGWRDASSSSSSTASASARIRRATRSWRPRMRNWHRLLARVAALRGSRHRGRRSACRRARWATARSATSTSAPGSASSRTCRGSTRPSPTARSATTRRSTPPAAQALERGRPAAPAGAHRSGRHPRRRRPHRGAWPSSRSGRGCRPTGSCLHAFTDGRDTPPRSADAFLPALLARHRRHARRSPRSAVATGPWTATAAGIGRARAYEAHRPRAGACRRASAEAAIAAAYARGEGDEFIQPTVVGPCAADGRRRRRRAPELPRRSGAAADPGPGAARLRRLRSRADAARRAGHDPDRVPGPPTSCRSRVASGRSSSTRWPPTCRGSGMRQLHVAETEKYAHVTYFFNGGVEEPFAGEERVLVPSRRDVATYDLAPAMSAAAITDALVEAAIEPARVRVHRRQLREPGHGRPHRRLGRGGGGGSRFIDGCLGRVARCGARAPARPGHHRRPRQHRGDAGRRRAIRRPSTPPRRCRSGRSVDDGAGDARLRDGDAGRRGADDVRAAGHPDRAADDRALAPRAVEPRRVSQRPSLLNCAGHADRSPHRPDDPGRGAHRRRSCSSSAGPASAARSVAR